MKLKKGDMNVQCITQEVLGSLAGFCQVSNGQSRGVTSEDTVVWGGSLDLFDYPRAERKDQWTIMGTIIHHNIQFFKFLNRFNQLTCSYVAQTQCQETISLFLPMFQVDVLKDSLDNQVSVCKITQIQLSVE